MKESQMDGRAGMERGATGQSAAGRSAAMLIVGLSLALASGCGGSKPPAAPADSGYDSAEAASDDDSVTSSGDAAAPAPQPAPQPMDINSKVPITTAEEAQAALDRDVAQLDALFGDQAVALSANNRCTRACRGFASLKRSVARLCELAGPETARCSSARDVEDSNRQRLADAACGC